MAAAVILNLFESKIASLDPPPPKTTLYKYYAVLLEIFILFSAVKEFWKSVKIWESYCQQYGGFLFGDTV